MKILRIAGCNLASLAGAFELDLESGPLAQAGLFAITGPTGSGKTTLLDALCLALYDRTPRLDKAGRVRIGHADQDEKHRLTAQDSRSLLRHDAGSGYAEVDFMGTGGGRYRARWALKRAGGVPSGKPQGVQLSLKDLSTGEAIGDDKKTVTLERIEGLLGLSFEQFTRSVLLAQGQFASFLRAKSKTRAELLERMTGTDLYARVSIAAFERAKESEQALQALRAELEDLGLLPAAELLDLKRERDTQKAAIQRDQALLQQAERLKGWQRTQERNLSAVASARETLTHASAAWEAAGPERDREALYQRHQDLGADLQAMQHADKRASVLGTELPDLRTRRDELLEQRNGQKERQQALQDQLAAHRIRRDALAPKIEEALQLQAALREQQERCTQTSKQVQEDQQFLADTKSALEQLRQQLEQAQTQKVEALSILEAAPFLARLLPDWKRLLPDLEKHAELHDSLRTSRPLEQRHQEAKAARALAHQAVQTAKTAQEDARSQRDQARDAVIPSPSQALESLREEQRRLQQGQALQQDHRQAQDKTSTLSTQVEENRARIAPLTQALELARSERDRAIGERDASSQAVEQLRRSLDLEHRRTELVDGEPCPLCGSTEHPYADNAPVHAALEALEQARQDKQEALELREGELLAARGALQTQRDRQEQLDEQLTEQQANEATAHGELERFRSAEPQASDMAAWERQLQQRAADLESLRVKAQESQELLSQRQAALDGAQEGLHAAQAELDQAQTALDASQHELSELERTRTRFQGLQEHILRSLEGLPGQWRGELQRDPAGQLERWSAQIPTLQAAQVQVETAEEKIQSTDTQRATTRERLKGATAAVEKATGVHRSALEKLERLRGDFQALEVPEPEVLRSQLRDTSQQLEQALSDAQARAGGLQEELARLETTLSGKEADLKQHQAQAAKARARLLDALDPSLDLAGLTGLLGEDRAARSERQDRLQELDKALLGARESLEALEGVASQHAEDRPEDPAPTVDLEQVSARLDEARQALARCSLKLTTHARASERSAELDAALREREKEHRIWAQLRATIGSKDGNAFREFAQGLTLETLLGHANVHLEDLAPRYRLNRVPGQDLDLQILDQALAGEVRSVASLSGGEGFLVSLALALGLASLSGSKTPVGTLFIDEGFGSLDPKSLDIALATLEALQAGGRQVGIISHVPGIGDHIGVQVEVLPLAPGRSHVVLPS